MPRSKRVFDNLWINIGTNNAFLPRLSVILPILGWRRWTVFILSGWRTASRAVAAPLPRPSSLNAPVHLLMKTAIYPSIPELKKSLHPMIHLHKSRKSCCDAFSFEHTSHLVSSSSFIIFLIFTAQNELYSLMKQSQLQIFFSPLFYVAWHQKWGNLWLSDAEKHFQLGIYYGVWPRLVLYYLRCN